MCNEGSLLYQNWVHLVPQVKRGDNKAEIRRKTGEITPASESARLAYQAHWTSCSVCQNEHLNADEYAKMRGWL
jgi:hypothetical protein